MASLQRRSTRKIKDKEEGEISPSPLVKKNQRIVRFASDPPPCSFIKSDNDDSRFTVSDGDGSESDDSLVADEDPSFQCAQPKEKEVVVDEEHGTITWAVGESSGDDDDDYGGDDPIVFPPRFADNFCPIKIFPGQKDGACAIRECDGYFVYPSPYCVKHMKEGRLGNDVYMKESTIKNAGYGLFAYCHLEKNEFVPGLFYDGRKISQFEANYCDGNYLFELVKGKTYLDMSDSKTASSARYINDPTGSNKSANVEIRPILLPDGVTIDYGVYAIKEIDEGAELFLDYGDEFWKALIDYRREYTPQVRMVLEKRQADIDFCVCGGKRQK